MLFDWAEGRREVVSIEGDLSTAVVMSETFPIYQLPMTGGGHGLGGPQIVYYLTLYTTVTSVVVGIIVFLYAAIDRYRINGRNLFVFNRVANLIWVGRPLLLLRGFTALLLLSSSQTQLVVQANGYSKFIFTPRTVWESFNVAGEATWIVYIVNDALLMLTTKGAQVAAPLTSLFVWITFVIMDAKYPVMLSTALSRECTAGDTDEYLYCQSGVVTVGSWTRVLMLLLVDIVALVAGYLVGFAYVWKHKKQSIPEAPLMLHGTAEVFLQTHSSDDTGKAWQLDSVASVMTGLIPFGFGGKQFLFDIKLWTVTKKSHGALKRSSYLIPESTQSADLKAEVPQELPKYWRFAVLGGLGYIFASGFGSISYIVVSKVNFANDFYWATFNMTAHHIAIADWINQQLWLDRNMTKIRLDDPKWSTLGVNYTSPTLQVVSSPWYGPRLQFEKLNTVRASIQGLRQSDGCLAPWIYSQYCWLDVQRRWAMANSPIRQTRCLADVSNGALYLETVLRNINWNEFRHCWGQAFDLAFGKDLELSQLGRDWLKMVQSNGNSIDDEVAYWANAGISSYTVQWQNYKLPGLINTYMIENAFGVQYPMTLSRTNGSFAIAAQTSYKMYWSFASDLWAVTQNATYMGWKSLIRSSPNYALTNHSMADVLVQNMTINLPLYAAYDLVQSQIGPFGSIDMKNVACPLSVKHLMGTGIDLIRCTNAANALASRYYTNIDPAMLDVHFTLPTMFLNISDWLAFGGNILCQDFGNTALTLGFFQYTSRLYPCGQWVTTLLEPSKDNVLISAVVAGLVQGSIDSVCAHDTAPSLCTQGFLGSSIAYLQTFLSPPDIHTLRQLVPATIVDVRALQPSLMQYVRENASAPLQMLTFQLLDPTDPSFDFWSWLHVFEWATGEREVVAFEGDVGAIHLLTEWTPPVAQPIQHGELPTTFTFYALAGVQYITGVMLAISGFVMLVLVVSRGHVEPWNLLEMNRVGGIVWVGRPLLLLRSVTALCLLSTATLELVVTHVASFAVPALPWYKTILGAGEAVWLVYVINDVVMVWTKQYTIYYATGSSLLVWFVAATLTLAQPVVHAATIAPDCHIDQMDFQLACESGVVVVGQASRLYWLLGIIGLSNVVGYGMARVVMRGQEKERQFALLSSSAQHLFNWSHWKLHDTYYIDPASALLNGLLVFFWGQRVFVMDIKLWRSFTFDVDKALPPRLQFALPLTD
ncbi:Aste57867_13561 [Aphanomyces stellatus]|uniref:Aste57867_13561 protein n=1 Tax=Aphanomyces stellatus TaxID=120398 RepID=A0A485KYD3_9STRA|nr:hypothetical protein As57867_013511 [Aphanomyces stellatus]VFT90399.1 Aste57867_13561 [Aphanomyces stellatus]